MTTDLPNTESSLGAIPLDTRDLIEEKTFPKKEKKGREGPKIELPQVKHAINYLRNVGPEGIGIFGTHGSGKSNLGYRICHYCLKRGDAILFKGDSFSEWRHLLDHGSKKTKQGWEINLLLPDPIDVDLFHFPTGSIQAAMRDYNLNILETPLKDFTPKTVLELLEPGKVLAIYDTFFTQATRTLFWAEVAEWLVSRRRLNDICITWVDNEISLLIPINSEKEQYKHVSRLAESFIEFRKALIRPIWICQVETELDWRLQKKIPWRMYPGDLIPVGNMPRGVKKHVLFSKRGKLVIVHGGKYRKNIDLPLFHEFEFEIRIIPPRTRITYGESEVHDDVVKIPLIVCSNCGHSWKPIKWNPTNGERPLKCPKCFIPLKWRG